MELNDALLGRRSIRAFLSNPVPREKITRIVDMARWAPSWGNTQPWEIVAADGRKAQELGRLFQDEGKKGSPPRPDIEIPAYFPDMHKNRYMELGKTLFTEMGIARGDEEARKQYRLDMYAFFGAPAVVYLLVDSRLNVPYSCLDIGSFGTTLCYAALQEGLGTIYLAASIHFPDIVRQVLSISDDKKVVIGIAIGVPHPDAPASVFRSAREPVEKMLRFA
jgi:nitroreductase